MSTDSLVKLMARYQNDYYQTQGKNTLFKKAQKQDCAKEMSKMFPLEDMIQRTVFINPGTNILIFDYTVFKLFATNDNSEAIIKRVIDLYDELLVKYPFFEVHINLDGFTISAAERYKTIIQQFCNRCMTASTRYTLFLKTMYLYYTPSMIDSISMLLKPFIDPGINERIVMYSKTDSVSIYPKLIENI